MVRVESWPMEDSKPVGAPDVTGHGAGGGVGEIEGDGIVLICSYSLY